MAKIRFGYSDDFTAKNSSVGINTTEPQQNLDVKGVVKGQDLRVTGVSSLTAYEGFLRADHQIAENTILSFDQGPSASLSGEIIVGTGQTVTVNEVVKDTAGVGNNGNNTWINLLDNSNGNAIPYGTKPKWDGNAFVFSADGEFQLDNFLESFGTSITVEWWGSSDYPTTNYKVPVMRTSTTAWTDGFGFFQYSGKVYWWVNAWNGAQRTEVVATSFGMTHWVGTYDGSNLKLYRNGSLVNTGSSFTSNVSNPAVSFDIGGSKEYVGYRWDGSISIVRLYKTALTAAEINAQWKLGPKSKIAVVEPDVVHLNANNPLSFPGTVSDVDTTDFTRAGGSEIECLKVFNTFTPPSGGTNERPYAPKPGELYYNYDFKTIEFFDGNGWRQVDNTTRSGRAVFAGGYSPTSGSAGNFASVMDYVNISTKGNAVNFGEMHAGTYAAPFGFSSATRGVFGGGYKNTTSTASNNDVAYITIASEGNTIDFGNLNSTKNWGKAAHASSTRGLAIGGYVSTTDIDYVEIATLGSFLDFGDLIASEFGGAGMGSPTIALSVGSGPNGYVNQVTIASKGNAIKWGETDRNPQYYAGGGSNSVRGLFNKTRQSTTLVQSLIIASSGTIENFGNLTSTHGVSSNYGGGNGNCASQTTLLFAGGGNNSASVNTIETISITTTGNATDFGDLTTKRGYMGACSDSHGGLGGF